MKSKDVCILNTKENLSSLHSAINAESFFKVTTPTLIRGTADVVYGAIVSVILLIIKFCLKLNMISKTELRALADALVTTLGDMKADDADRIVRQVAETIYKDALGLKGRLVKNQFCILCQYDGCHFSWNYKWEDDTGEEEIK